jgi:hypothetical protein
MAKVWGLEERVESVEMAASAREVLATSGDWVVTADFLEPCIDRPVLVEISSTGLS